MDTTQAAGDTPPYRCPEAASKTSPHICLPRKDQDVRNRMYYLRRTIIAVILLGVLLYHSAGLISLLEEALTASPHRQAAGIIFLAVTALLGRIIWSAGAAVVVGARGTLPTYALAPMGVARLTRLGAATMSDLERWAEIHKHKGESTKDAVKRLEPLWNQRELDEDISITQRRRHEAAHAVITHAIETNKKLLAERQDAITAIETALTDKDKLTGVEVHHILDNLNTPHLKPTAEVAG